MKKSFFFFLHFRQTSGISIQINVCPPTTNRYHSNEVFFSDLNFVFVLALRDDELLKIIFLYKWEIWLSCIFGLLKYINWFVTGYLPCGDEYNFGSWRNNLFCGLRLRMIALTENINLIWIFQWILIILPPPTMFLRLSIKVYKRFAIK